MWGKKSGNVIKARKVDNDDVQQQEEESAKGWRPPSQITELYRSVPPNMFSATNRPTAGPRDDNALPEGNAPLQLYSLATPNGQKVRIRCDV